MDKVKFPSENLTLVGVWHLPKQKTNKAIVLAHGITVDKDEDGVFIQLANSLQQNGYAVFRFDFRGHGDSEGKSIDMTVSGEVKDILSAVNYVKSNSYNEVGLLGASFGGGSSALYTSQYQSEIKCLCLWNPVLNYEHTFLNPTLPWIKAKKEHMAREIKERGWTTLGSKKYVVGIKLFTEMEALKPYEELKSIMIPTIIIHGTKDTKVPYEDSKEYVTYLSNGSLFSLDGAEHGFHEDNETIPAINETVSFFQKNL